MSSVESVEKTAKFVKQKFSGEHTGHDWWHIYRVWQLSKYIATREKGANLQIVELAALLHDIADFKFHGSDFEAGPKAARSWLESQRVEEEVIVHIENIIRNISFKSIDSPNNLTTKEGQIVHDADKLDAMGAIGIARVFAFGGSHQRLIYDPDKPQLENYTFERSQKHKSSAIHHFYEKLLYLRGRMYTETGKKMAKARHEYMEDFLKEFYAEWDGKS